MAPAASSNAVITPVFESKSTSVTGARSSLAVVRIRMPSSRRVLPQFSDDIICRSHSTQETVAASEPNPVRLPVTCICRFGSLELPEFPYSPMTVPATTRLPDS